ncbi:Adenosylcobinamide-phosphate guanylyltransferase [invertebrate metagenome]|uniref:Adenosylcobinamide kinase n=1 Tax=invertebrate metagenome TaxID=1711999 RepID=A0A484H845_9ZZZZ
MTIVVPLRPEALIPLAPLSLVIGGARSGKSVFAETMVTAHAARVGQQPVYIATAEVCDDEMAERVRYHRNRRGNMWCTVESPLQIEDSLKKLPKGAPILVDCLTMWLANLLLAGRDSTVSITSLLARLIAAPGPVVVVSNIVGCGIVPDNAIARAFRDHAGHLNQRVAVAARCVILVTAGLPLVLKAL